VQPTNQGVGSSNLSGRANKSNSYALTPICGCPIFSNAKVRGELARNDPSIDPPHN
jgi:hypothetical protein